MSNLISSQYLKECNESTLFVLNVAVLRWFLVGKQVKIQVGTTYSVQSLLVCFGAVCVTRIEYVGHFWRQRKNSNKLIGEPLPECTEEGFVTID